MFVLKLNVLILFLSASVFGNYHQNEHDVEIEVSVTSPPIPRYIPKRNPNKRFHENIPYRLPENFLPNDSNFLTHLKLQPVQNEVVQFPKLRPGKRPPREGQHYNQATTTSKLATTVDWQDVIPVETTATTEESWTTGRDPTDSDEPVTSEQSSTTDTEEQSTTDTPIICNTSLHTKEDLEEIINYFAEKLQVIPKVVGSFNTTLIPDKHLRDITLFHQWFKDRPFHLQHVLEDIRLMRKELDPLINKVQERLSVQTPILEEKNKDKKLRLSKTLRKLTTQFTLCEVTCERENIVERLKTEDSNASDSNDSPMQDENPSYCGSIAYIYSQVTTKLTVFIASMQNVFQDRLLNKDIEYGTRVEEVKNKLKNTALNKFGRTLYDILNLQDLYHHLWKKMEQIDEEEKIIYDIKKNNAQIDIKFITLEILIADLAKHCRNCENTLLSRNLIASKFIEESPQESTTTYDNDEHQDNEETQTVNNMLNDLIDLKLQNIEQQIELYYDRIFESLENSLNEANSSTSYIEDLQLIEADISKATKEEHDRLNDLKEHISETDIYTNILHEIVKDSNKILDTINVNIEKVNHYLNHAV